MTKKNFLRAILIAAALGISTPTSVGAATQKKEYGNEHYPDWFNKLLEFSIEADKEAHKEVIDPSIEKYDKIKKYDIEKLMLITDQNKHSFFINKDSVAKIEWNFYYDEKGINTFDMSKALYKENRKMFLSITDPNTTYVPRTFTNLKTREVTSNYQEWEELFLVYDEEGSITYFVNPHPENIIPEKYLNAASLKGYKLSIKELKEIEAELNQYDYQKMRFNQQSHQNPILNRQR